MIEGKGLFFKMSSFGLHHGLEMLQGGATCGMDLFRGDGVPRWPQGSLQMVDTAEGFSANPSLQNRLDAEVHDVQVWRGGGHWCLAQNWGKKASQKLWVRFEVWDGARLAERWWGRPHTPTQSMAWPLHSGDGDRWPCRSLLPPRWRSGASSCRRRWPLPKPWWKRVFDIGSGSTRRSRGCLCWFQALGHCGCCARPPWWEAFHPLTRSARCAIAQNFQDLASSLQTLGLGGLL